MAMTMIDGQRLYWEVIGKESSHQMPAFLALSNIFKRRYVTLRWSPDAQGGTI